MGVWTGFELKILDLIQNLRSPGMDKLMVDITTLGNASLIWIAFIIVFISTREYKQMGKLMIIAFIANIIIVNLLLKNIVGRTRPYEYVKGIELLVPALSDGSFPSGHSSYAFTMATIIIIMARGSLLKVFVGILAILISFSRLYLYVHFPTDVIAGSIVGILIATYTMKIYFSDEYDRLKHKIHLQRRKKRV